MPEHEYVGNIHIHTRYSDGSGDVNLVRRAGRRAGLDFLIVTDHQTLAGRTQQGWQDGLLLLVGEELGTHAGHCLGLGLDQASLETEPRAMIAAATRQGGLGIIAHPHDLRYSWPDWECTGFDGLSLWNYTSQWLGKMQAPLTKLLYLVMPGLAITSPPGETLAQWDALHRRGLAVPGLGASDAHAFGWRPCGVPLVILPYRLLLRAINTHVLLTQPLTGRLPEDERLILAALRRGACFVANDARGCARGFRFLAQAGEESWTMGETAPYKSGLSLKAAAPRPGWIVLRRDGVEIFSAYGRSLDLHDPEPGVYRVEVYRDKKRRWGWVFSNPIWVH